MKFLTRLLTGGFLAGYRTYLVGAGLIVDAFVKWAAGDLTGVEFAQSLPEMLAGLGLMTLRAAVPDKG